MIDEEVAVKEWVTMKEKQPMKLRHEYKFSINEADDYIVSNRLRKLFKQDEFADEFGNYRVSSLYFDTLSIKPYVKSSMGSVNVRNFEFVTTMMI
mgnify:CR=1 FL=1